MLTGSCPVTLVQTQTIWSLKGLEMVQMVLRIHRDAEKHFR